MSCGTTADVDAKADTRSRAEVSVIAMLESIVESSPTATVERVGVPCGVDLIGGFARVR